MHRDAVNTVANLCLRVRDILGHQTAVDWLPGVAAIVGAKGARSGDGDEYSASVTWIEQDRVQTQPTRARLPSRPRAMAAQSGQFLPGLTAVSRAEERSIFNAGVDGIGVRE